MAHPSPARPVEELDEAKPTPADLKAEQATLFATLSHLWPFIWPSERFDLKMRVVWSMMLLLVAKAATLVVPFTFKWAVDALTGADTAPVQAANWTLWLIASPIIMSFRKDDRSPELVAMAAVIRERYGAWDYPIPDAILRMTGGGEEA